MTNTPEQSTLGQKTQYDAHYNPEMLFPISRTPRRQEIGIQNKLPFFGFDLWNHYEVSWLNEKGKPVVALAEIIYSCESPNIIESKSMKLYFNTLNQTQFKDAQHVASTVKKDLAERLNSDQIMVNVIPLAEVNNQVLAARLEGINIDELDVSCTEYHTQPNYLKTHDNIVSETLVTDLLKSNCLVTNQPDWCSVQITYEGPQIDKEGLLKYIVSFRNDNEFHEQSIEKIFVQLLERCKPSSLSVYGRSNRRGGLDINSYRSTDSRLPPINNTRLCRQ
jgi:7-cyano-7-deazaguanine reductase